MEPCATHTMESVNARRDTVEINARVLAHPTAMEKTARRFADVKTAESAITFLVNATAHQDSLGHCKLIAVLTILLSS